MLGHLPRDLCSQGLGFMAGAVLTLVLPLRALTRERVLPDLLPFLLNLGDPHWQAPLQGAQRPALQEATVRTPVGIP